MASLRCSTDATSWPSAVDASRAFCRSSQIHLDTTCARFDSRSRRCLYTLCAVFSVRTVFLTSSLGSSDTICSVKLLGLSGSTAVDDYWCRVRRAWCLAKRSPWRPPCGAGCVAPGSSISSVGATWRHPTLLGARSSSNDPDSIIRAAAMYTYGALPVADSGRDQGALGTNGAVAAMVALRFGTGGGEPRRVVSKGHQGWTHRHHTPTARRRRRPPSICWSSARSRIRAGSCRQPNSRRL